MTDGEALPFALKFPEAMPPSGRFQLCERKWQFEVEVNIARGPDLSGAVDVEVLPAGSQRSHSANRPAMPVIGSRRLLTVWTKVAQNHGLQVSTADGSVVLEGTFNECVLSIQRTISEEQGYLLEGTLRFASVHLGLQGGLAGRLRRALGGGVSSGDPAWDRAHYITAREQEQAQGFVTVLATVVRRHTCDLAKIVDDRIVVNIRDSGQTPEGLVELTSIMRVLAASLSKARSQILVPVCMTAFEAPWLLLAKRLSGKLERSRMAVFGHYEEIPCEVVTHWSEQAEPTHTSITLIDSEGVLSHQNFESCEGMVTEGALAELPEPARVVVEEMMSSAATLSIKAGRLQFDDVAPIGEVAQLQRRLAELSQLLGALGTRHGPYR